MYCQTSSSVQLLIGKIAHVLALVDPAVVEAPQLGPLVARIPAAERVAMAEDPLLRAGLLLVPPTAAEQRVEPVLLDRVEQGDRLEPVARRVVAGLLVDAAGVDRRLDRGDDEPLAELGDPPVAEVERLGEVVAGVDVDDREREAGRAGTPSRRGAAGRSNPCRR